MTRRHSAPRRLWQRARSLFGMNIWDIEVSAVSRPARAGVRTLRVLHLIIRGFFDDECPLQASALTFSTMMSIVPILALCLALLRGLGGEDLARERLHDAVQEWTRSFAAGTPSAGSAAVAAPRADAADDWTPDSLAAEIEQLIDKGFEKVRHINFAALGGVGLVVLILTIVMVLGSVESAFNRVWGVKTGRTLIRKFTDYVSALMVLPFLLVVATSLPLVDFASQFLPSDAALQLRALAASPVVRHATVLLTLTILFTFLIKFMPNTRVRLLPAVSGGLFASLLFIGWLAVCAALQVGAAHYGRIYGSFAVVPILLAWVYVSWEIVLLSAELAFALQNAATYRVEQGAEHASVESRLTLALAVLTDAARGLAGGGRAFDAARFAAEHRIPVRLLNTVIGQLTRAGFIGELGESSGRYALLCAPDACRVSQVATTLLSQGVSPIALGFLTVPQPRRDAAARAVRPHAGGAAPRDPVLAELARTVDPPPAP